MRATAERGVERLQRGGRVRSVDQQLHLRRITGADVLGEFRRNLQPGVGTAFANLARHLVDALHFADHAKRFRIDETIDELAALDRAIFIQE